MKATGKKTNNMVKVLRHGLMVLPIKEIILRERNMGLDALPGLTIAPILVNSLKTILKVRVFINGLMGESMMGSGKIIRWKDMEYLPGLMVGNMKENTEMIKKKVKESSFGLMEEDMMEIGRMGSNME